MANDKDFLLKNAVEVGGPTNVTLGTVTNNDIDLSTGNYFVDTPTGTSTYTFSNAGDVQSFQLEVTGGVEEIASNFSTTLYTGTGQEQTIINNIDLSVDGGLVWIKNRTGTGHGTIFDTERGIGNYIMTSLTNAAASSSEGTRLTAFNSDGFSLGTDPGQALNNAAYNYTSWTFRKAPKFFDVVTYTGNSTSGREIAHNLGTTPGCIIVKTTNVATNWAVYHRGMDATNPEQYGMWLDLANARALDSTRWNNTAPSSTVFTVGNAYTTNSLGNEYVAYLFAHDTASDGQIQCGSYTGNGSTTGPTINLGWEPQWVLVKQSSTSGQWWQIIDTQRGFDVTTGAQTLGANSPDPEYTNAGFGSSTPILSPTSTGFQVRSNQPATNANGETYIYIAIREASALDLTWPTSIEWAGGISPAAPATGETDLFTFSTDDGGTSYIGLKTADNLS